ncbi:Alpha-L-rhamnosidase like protein [Verticillium longisporum]|uniref:Alpha-L-rhamnosidase like protein n=1 Tax=Verticillium longisporum TaxID=100787 RepID=A0A8I2ZV22_VERLO|nr:Alpha-L-rhamnosidase like protein [Verticillium longisporum]
MSLPTVTDVRFEHHRPGQALGVDDTRPRLSWRFAETPNNFSQEEYEVKIERIIGAQVNHLGSVKVISPESRLVPWPLEQPLASRTRCSVSVRARQQAQQEHTAWSDPAILETGLLHRRDWSGQLISAPWAGDDIETPLPEDLFRKNFTFDAPVQSARLYITALGVFVFDDGSTRTITTDDTWTVNKGPVQRSEIYDGELYDATAEVPGWSIPGFEAKGWAAVDTLPPIADTVQFHAGDAEPVRRLEIVKPNEKITTPSGKTVLDFGQNLVGYLRVNKVRGPRGHKITLLHAEVLEKGELGIRPLRDCKARDIYALRGDEAGESYEPRFTFHGFRYAQVDDWPSADIDILDSLEAVLYSNVRWGMRGNFLSVPTDCPQRDERLGWTGDLALFAPTATFIYDCTGILKNWLRDLWDEQKRQDGVPPMVVLNVVQGHFIWGKIWPAAI